MNQTTSAIYTNEFMIEWMNFILWCQPAPRRANLAHLPWYYGGIWRFLYAPGCLQASFCTTSNTGFLFFPMPGWRWLDNHQHWWGWVLGVRTQVWMKDSQFHLWVSSYALHSCYLRLLSSGSRAPNENLGEGSLFGRWSQEAEARVQSVR
jgi:hypothetical protein